jgi:hypothetical protein
VTLYALPHVADFAPGDDTLPHLDDIANSTPVILRKQIGRYLAEASCVVATTAQEDPREPERGPVIGFSVMTDGDWVWPQYWAYLVSVYGADLPEAFVEHIRENDFDPPRLTTQRLVEIDDERADAVVVPVGAG